MAGYEARHFISSIINMVFFYSFSDSIEFNRLFYKTVVNLNKATRDAAARWLLKLLYGGNFY